MIKVKSEVPVYEIDGKETRMVPPTNPIDVMSHWNVNQFVVLDVNGTRFTVAAKDLIAAVNNATNSVRF